MGFFDAGLKAGMGYPNPGWSPSLGGGGLGSDTISGALITYDRALTVGAFQAGIRLIAEDIASLPFLTYQRLPVGKRRAPEHRLYTVLHDSPNPEMTSMVWQETGIGHVYSWGNWYSEKELDGQGRTVRIWPLRVDRMKVDLTTGVKVFKYRLPDGTGVILPAKNVLHVPGFGFDGLVGYSRISLMRRQLESAIAVEEYGLQTFANGAQPGVVIKHPSKLSDTAKLNINESWQEQHRGLTNAQRSAILDEGMSIEQVGFNPEDAQFLESRRFSVEEVARGLRLSPHKLSDFSRATFSNIEESNIDHVVSTLGPPIVRIDQQVKKDLFDGDREFFAEHLVDGQLRGKFLERMQGHQIAIGIGMESPDEARETENRNPIPDGAGATFLAPLNLSPLDLLAAAVLARTNGSSPAPTNGVTK
jgi:HK97 family phage portal protein